MKLSRIMKRNNAVKRKAQILYWMSRDQRVSDNCALINAQKEAINFIIKND